MSEKADKAVVVLSGGLDSTIALRQSMEKYGQENVQAISFDYQQRQNFETLCAKKICEHLSIKHQIIDISFLSLIGKGFSANTDKDLKMPTIQDVIGNPQPLTYVPNRNMILMSIAASFAEVQKANKIVMGLQVHDEYAYHDVTQIFVDAVNCVLQHNRTWPIEVVAPFISSSKTRELVELLQMDGNLDLTRFTLTCYNPAIPPALSDNFSLEGHNAISCGVCPSCSERIQAFKNISHRDKIPYAIDIEW